MCHRCDGFNEIIEISLPYEYFHLVSQLKDLVSQGAFLVKGDCSLDEIQEGKTWPADHITHHFICTNCKKKFTLSVETYHGRGGSWEPMAEENGTHR